MSSEFNLISLTKIELNYKTATFRQILVMVEIQEVYEKLCVDASATLIFVPVWTTLQGQQCTCTDAPVQV